MALPTGSIISFVSLPLLAQFRGGPSVKRKHNREYFPQKGLSCSSCHTDADSKQFKKENVNRGASNAAMNSCAPCHGKEPNKPASHHGNVFGKDCLSCHSMGSFTPQGHVDSKKTSAPCSACHQGTGKQLNWSKKNHEKNKMGKNCWSCHSVFGNSLSLNRGALSNHFKTTSYCKTCHTNSGAMNPPQNVHHPGSPKICTPCHSIPPKIDSQTIKPEYLKSECSQCHTSSGGKKVPATRHHSLGFKSCKSCHEFPPSKKNIVPGRVKKLFRSNKKCSQCHTKTGAKKTPQDNYHHKGKPTTCDGCHTTVPRLQSSLRQQIESHKKCGSCHEFGKDVHVSQFFMNWERVKMHHKKEGAPFLKPCLDCHDERLRIDVRKLSGIKAEKKCTECHKSDEQPRHFKTMQIRLRHHEKDFGPLAKDCLACHNEKLEVKIESVNQIKPTPNCAPCHTGPGGAAVDANWDVFIRHPKYLPASHAESETCDKCHDYHNLIDRAKKHQGVAYHHTHGMPCADCHHLPPTLSGIGRMSGTLASLGLSVFSHLFEDANQPRKGHSQPSNPPVVEEPEYGPGTPYWWIGLLIVTAAPIAGYMSARHKQNKRRAQSEAIERQGQDLKQEIRKLQVDPSAKLERQVEEMLRAHATDYDIMPPDVQIRLREQVLNMWEIDEVRGGKSVIDTEFVRRAIADFDLGGWKASWHDFEQRRQRRRDLWRRT